MKRIALRLPDRATVPRKRGRSNDATRNDSDSHSRLQQGSPVSWCPTRIRDRRRRDAAAGLEVVDENHYHSQTGRLGDPGEPNLLPAEMARRRSVEGPG